VRKSKKKWGNIGSPHSQTRRAWLRQLDKGRIRTLRLFDKKTYRLIQRNFTTKAKALAYASKYRSSGKKRHARVVTFGTGRHMVYVNPCGGRVHSRWYYVHKASGKSPKQRAIGAEKANIAGYKKYLERIGEL